MPCDDSGGDVFNIYTLDDTHLALYILDVSGHGVPSAMVTVSVSQMLSLQAGTTRHTNGGQQVAAPAEVLSALAAEYPFERFQKFFTIAYLVLNHRDGMLRYSGAGHPEPVVQRRNGSIELLSAGGTIIGLGNAIRSRKGRCGSTLAIGCFSTPTALSSTPMPRRVLRHPALPAGVAGKPQPAAEAACDHLIATMQRFGSGTAPTDDVTLVALEMHETDSLLTTRREPMELAQHTEGNVVVAKPLEKRLDARCAGAFKNKMHEFDQRRPSAHRSRYLRRRVRRQQRPRGNSLSAEGARRRGRLGDLRRTGDGHEHVSSSRAWTRFSRCSDHRRCRARPG